MIVAIDGLAASGKGTLALVLSEHLGLPRLDTGRLYRAAGLACLDARISLDDATACADIARRADSEAFTPGRLASAAAARAASDIGALEAVRAALFDRQRAFATRSGGAILDGRDIGTVIAPDADVKFWLHAAIETRALRRWRQSAPDDRVDLARLCSRLAERDAADAGRDHCPARPAADAIVIDTTDLDRSAVLSSAMEVISAKRQSM